MLKILLMFSKMKNIAYLSRFGNILILEVESDIVGTTNKL